MSDYISSLIMGGKFVKRSINQLQNCSILSPKTNSVCGRRFYTELSSCVSVSATCQSMQQKIPDGKSRAGGEPSNRREERKKGNCGACFLYYAMLKPRERRMSLTGVNEEAGWFPRLPMFPTHTSLLIIQPHFSPSCCRQFPKSNVLLGDRRYILF